MIETMHTTSTTPAPAEDLDGCPRCGTPIILEQFQDLTILRHRDGRLEITGCSRCPSAAAGAAAAAS